MACPHSDYWGDPLTLGAEVVTVVGSGYERCTVTALKQQGLVTLKVTRTGRYITRSGNRTITRPHRER